MIWHLQKHRWFFLKNKQIVHVEVCDLDTADRIGMKLHADEWTIHCPPESPLVGS